VAASLREEDALQDHCGCVTTSEYLYETPDPRWPRFKLRLCPQRHETDAQYAAYRRDIEHHTLSHGNYLDQMHRLCTSLGNHRNCAVRGCRRRGRCCGRRDEDRYSISLRRLPALHTDRRRHHRNLPHGAAGDFEGAGAAAARTQGDCHGRLARLAGFHSGGGWSKGRGRKISTPLEHRRK
jgi:hypothetical protein